MKRHLTTAASALALGLLSTGVAAAACNTDLTAAEKAIGDKRDAYGPSAPDLRRLRDAAQTLAAYGKDGACETVVKAINELAAAPPTYLRDGMPAPRTPAPGTATAPPAPGAATAPPAAGVPPAAAPRFEYDRMAAAKDTVAVIDAKAMTSVDQIIGATIYSAVDGRSLGEIEDIVLASNTADSFAIIGYGGFLGMGEKKVRVPLKDLMVNTDYNTYYVKLADAEFKATRGLKKVNGRWVDAAN